MTSEPNRKRSTTDEGHCDYCNLPFDERRQPAMLGRRRGDVCEACSSSLRNFSEQAEFESLDRDAYID